MDHKQLKKFLFIYKKLLPIRDINEISKKKIQLISKEFQGTNAIPLIKKIYFEQLSYFFKLFFGNDFDNIVIVYKEKKNTDSQECLKQCNYLMNKIHCFIQLCEGNISLIDVGKPYKIRVRNRIHSLISHFTMEFEDLIFFYYSQAFKRFNFFYYHRIIYTDNDNEKRNHCLTEEDRFVVDVPELNNFVVGFDYWDPSDFYKEYIEELEEEDNNDNFNDMLYEEDCSKADDSIMVDEKDSLMSKKMEVEDSSIEMSDSRDDQESELNEMDDDMNNEEDNNNEEIETDSSDDEGYFERIEEENENNGIMSDDYDSDINEDRFETNIHEEQYIKYSKDFLKKFAINCSHINEDHILYRYESIISNIINRHIHTVISKRYKGIFNKPCLVNSMSWYKCSLVSFHNIIWLPNIYHENQKSFISWNARMRFYIYRNYFDLRTSELFDIIVEYPDSKWALIDLKISMKKTGLIKELITSLNDSLKKRLLHQGAKTSDIIQQYISLIKCMQILDSSGLLLEQVSGPIKKYLRDREDTIKCIIQFLVDENNYDLFESVQQQDIVAFDEMNLDNYNNDNWMPELLKIDPTNEVVKRKRIDIISTLLNIYDTKDMFIKEFQELLASRLLALKGYNLRKELKNLELLKLRFGENNLQLCEVMIKDISSSRRIDYNIHTDFKNNLKENYKRKLNDEEAKDNESNDNKELPIHAKILSHLYWPSFKPQNLKFPKEIQKYVDIYSKKYTMLKPQRKLQWLPFLGNVSLTVELEDRTLTFNDLTPMQAIILYHFQDQDQWSLDELSDKLEVTPTIIKRDIIFWINKGVIKEISKNVFKTLETKEEINIVEEDINQPVEETDEDSGVQSNKEQETEQMRIYWTFISNMVTNLGGMTIERIHQMLEACLPNYTSSIDQLKSFLELMVHENKLDFTADLYFIKK